MKVYRSVLCSGLLVVGVAAFADDPIPADPTGKFNQMITNCMAQQDPALKKEDALRACKDKMKQGVQVDKKPKDASQKPPPPKS